MLSVQYIQCLLQPHTTPLMYVLHITAFSLSPPQHNPSHVRITHNSLFPTPIHNTTPRMHVLHITASSLLPLHNTTTRMYCTQQPLPSSKSITQPIARITHNSLFTPSHSRTQPLACTYFTPLPSSASTTQPLTCITHNSLFTPSLPLHKIAMDRTLVSLVPRRGSIFLLHEGAMRNAGLYHSRMRICSIKYHSAWGFASSYTHGGKRKLQSCGAIRSTPLE